MKRLLITTTALSIALSGFSPAMLMAQQVGADGVLICPPEGGPGCPEPTKKKKKKQEAGQDGGANTATDQPQTEKKKKKKQAEAEQVPAPDVQPAPKPKKQPATDPQVLPPALEQPDAPSSDGATGGKKKKAQTVDAPAADAPVIVPVPGTPEVSPDNAIPDNAPAAVKKEGRKKKPVDPNVLPEIAPSQGAETPDRKAVVALSDIITDEDAEARSAEGDEAPRRTSKPRKPAAADIDLTAAAPSAKVTQRKVTEADIRRSKDDFKSKPVSDKDAKKHDGGLSDLEKAGLVVLGALVVGSLLNNGDQVVSNTGDRVIVDRGDGQYAIYKDDNARLFLPGSDVRTETFPDGSTRTTVYRSDGTQIVTIRDASGRVLRSARINLDGSQTLLIDDLSDRVQPVNLSTLPRPVPGSLVVSTSQSDAELRAEMLRMRAGQDGRAYSLAQIRDYSEVRALSPMIDVDNVVFASGSAAIDPNEAPKLQQLGTFMKGLIDRNPAEMFLIEGHTDAVGDAAYNLALSDRRAESLALALTEYFGVPPENMVVQGYGEGELLVPTGGDEPRNRRAVVRMISPLMQQVASN
ncbi:Outer membrane protein OmpA [Gemmobacter aquatilis]|uniref:Outer membrane protein OmpA n=1 Tax=Gemmobacter aquatilis TaxID=933059 RepID=A0A1H8C2Z0_9RHOB|nr:OmpA family protein [Gemmobacter aquatilis]SEM89219.1 Outer membrane protein OmpA [Gemmobacter aquatilis]